jgi:hypothetical protein
MNVPAISCPRSRYADSVSKRYSELGIEFLRSRCAKMTSVPDICGEPAIVLKTAQPQVLGRVA